MIENKISCIFIVICFVLIFNKVCVLVWIELEGIIFEKRKMFEIDLFDFFYFILVDCVKLILVLDFFFKIRCLVLLKISYFNVKFLCSIFFLRVYYFCFISNKEICLMMMFLLFVYIYFYLLESFLYWLLKIN